MIKTLIVNRRRVTTYIARPELTPTIIFLHGFRGDHRGLIDLANTLVGYRVIVPDLPGYGTSEPMATPHDFVHYSRWLTDFRKALGLHRYVLAGHSYGASLAIVHASRAPAGIDRLVLLTPVITAASITSKLGEAYYQISRRLPPRLRRSWLANALLNRLTAELLTATRDRRLRKQIIRHEATNLRYVIPDIEIESFLGFYDTDFYTAAKKIHLPSFIIAAGQDRMTAPSFLRAYAAEFTAGIFQIIPSVGHFINAEKPRETAVAILEFLRPS